MMNFTEQVGLRVIVAQDCIFYEQVNQNVFVMKISECEGYAVPHTYSQELVLII